MFCGTGPNKCSDIQLLPPHPLPQPHPILNLNGHVYSDDVHIYFYF